MLSGAPLNRRRENGRRGVSGGTETPCCRTIEARRPLVARLSRPCPDRSRKAVTKYPVPETGS